MPDIVQNTIRERRIGKGITQENLARVMGVSRQTIIAIEGGRYTPSLPLAMKLARYFKTTIEDLFTLNL